LSTTTQAISPSQGTVSWSTLNADTQQDLGISFKNRIINGAMVIDQRNAGASVTQTTSNLYPVDRFLIYGSVTSKFTAQQSSTAPVGFVNSLLITSSAATTPASGDLYILRQAIEGYNIADLNWGSANAKTVTLSFQVYSSLTGTFGGSLTNGDVNRSYPFSYTVSSANTWTTVSVTIAGPTSGTWNTTNGTGIRLYFNLGAGSTYNGTAGSWATTSDVTFPTGATSVVGTNGATFYLTGVMLEVGTQATTFDNRSYGTELSLCYRYYWQRNIGVNDYPFALQAYSGTSVYGPIFQFPVTMRATPSMTSGGAFLAQQANSGSSNTISSFASGLGARSAFGCYSDGTGGFSGMVAGNMSVVFCNAASYVAASAEL
jgi:hypothetical protein